MSSLFEFEPAHNAALNLFGMGCSGIALGVIAWMSKCVCGVLTAGWFREPRVSRVSLNLQAAIALVDLVRHFRLLFYNSDSAVMCSLMGFLLFFGEHLNMLLNVAIAANLHRMLLQQRMPGQRWFKLLWILPPTVAFCIDVIPLGKSAARN